jgi:glycine/D-amino acid oxidase-like deaminating enzyme
VLHDRLGWWVADAGAPSPLPTLSGDLTADVVVVGGGYTGMWAAWHLLAAGASVVLLEAEVCGTGPSGRNGGFCSSLDLQADPASPLGVAGREAVAAIGAWCAEQEVDAWFREAPHWVVSTAPAQDGASAEHVDGSHVTLLDAGAVRARCASPRFRGAVEVRCGATVHPARLAFGLRERLRAAGAQIFEHSRVTALRTHGPSRPPIGMSAGPCVVDTVGGRVRAGAALVCAGSAGAALRPLRGRLTVGSSHIVITEPVPDVIEELGWTGGEAISDGRALLHYTRTTRDGRILFGWAGGRMAAGTRTGGRMEIDPDAVATAARDLVRWFPQLEGRRIEHAWGGPIDVSPTHMPEIRTVGPSAWAAFGYTGNGVGPAHLYGRVLADLALGRGTDLPIVDPPARRVPPEPLRVAGAAVLRRALARKEAIEEEGGRAPLALRALAGLPARIGVRVVR